MGKISLPFSTAPTALSSPRAFFSGWSLWAPLPQQAIRIYREGCQAVVPPLIRPLQTISGPAAWWRAENWVAARKAKSTLGKRICDSFRLPGPGTAETVNLSGIIHHPYVVSAISRALQPLAPPEQSSSRSSPGKRNSPVGNRHALPVSHRTLRRVCFCSSSSPSLRGDS